MNTLTILGIGVLVGLALCGFAVYVEHSWKMWRLMRDWDREFPDKLDREGRR